MLAKQARSEAASAIPRRSKRVIAGHARVALKEGVPLVSAELAVESPVSVLGGRNESVMAVRGVEPAFFDVRQVEVVNGSSALRGHIVLLGRAAQRRLDVRVGSVSMFGERWVVGGLFDGRAGVLDLGILADLHELMRAANRDAYSSLTVKAETAEDVATLVDRLGNDRRIAVTAMPERDHDLGSRRRAIVVAWLGVLGSLLGLAGAALGLRSAMEAVVPRRARAAETSRALGLGATGVLVALVTEPVLVGLAGGLLAVGLRALLGAALVGVLPARLPLDLTPGIAGACVALSVAVGLAGGLPAAATIAARASRRPPRTSGA